MSLLWGMVLDRDQVFFFFIVSHFPHHHLLDNSSFPTLICGDTSVTFVTLSFVICCTLISLCKWVYVCVGHFVSSCAIITLFFVCLVFTMIGLIVYSYVLGLLPYVFHFRYSLNLIKLQGLYYYLCFTHKETDAQKIYCHCPKFHEILMVELGFKVVSLIREAVCPIPHYAQLVSSWSVVL